jgi:hypothetical protein
LHGANGLLELNSLFLLSLSLVLSLLVLTPLDLLTPFGFAHDLGLVAQVPSEKAHVALTCRETRYSAAPHQGKAHAGFSLPVGDHAGSMVSIGSISGAIGLVAGSNFGREF